MKKNFLKYYLIFLGLLILIIPQIFIQEKIYNVDYLKITSVLILLGFFINFLFKKK